MAEKLVAYFSCSGVTAEKAKLLSKAANADIFEIKPEAPYTNADANWRNPLSRCNREKIKGTKPPIVKDGLDISKYDVIFLGFPIWYYCEPLVIDSFLDAFDCKGKTVVLFATSGGSEFGKTLSKISAKYPGVNFVEGLLLNGNTDIDTLNEFSERF